LVRRRAKFTVAKLAGIEIWRAERREEEDDVVRGGEKNGFLPGRGVFIGRARRFGIRIQRWKLNGHAVGWMTRV
jgi:hypothetical protein